MKNKVTIYGLQEDKMKKNSLAALIVGICILTFTGAASAENYTFHWFNNINYFTDSNNRDAVCNNVSAKVMVAGKIVGQNTLGSPLKSAERKDLTVSAPACTNIILSATCTYRELLSSVTKTTQKSVMCWGGDAIVLPDPVQVVPTNIGITYYCTAPCK